MTIRKGGALVTALLCAMLALAPAMAEAAAGSRSNQGSRGSRTSTPNNAAPIERSTAAPPARQAPVAPAPQRQAPAPGYQPSPGFMGGMGGSIMTGIMAGVAGSFIGNMIFGSHGAQAAQQNADASPTGSFIGGLLPYLLIGGLGLLAFMMFRRRSQAARMAPEALARGPVDLSGLRGGPGGGAGGGIGGGYAGAAAPTADLAVGADDQEAFGKLLVDIQTAWGRNDTQALRPLLTDEMASYFAGQLADLKGRGLANRIEEVTLLEGKGGEAWSEDGSDYATAYLRWSAKDYTVSTETNQVVEGSRERPVEIAEVWTFRRDRGGPWKLSAIQQLS
jgi:predicted lipid-binding transport protein (Tim44 family)